MPQIAAINRWKIYCFIGSLIGSVAGYAAEAPATTERLDIAGRTIDLEIAPDAYSVNRDQLRGWVQTGAKAVSTYYGKFPVPHLRLTIAAQEDGRAIHGATYGGRLIRMRIGSHTTAADLRND